MLNSEKEINGVYGSHHTPCTVFVYPNRDGSSWYVVEGSTNVNQTYDDLEDGVDVEEVNDIDTFTAGSPINSLDDLVREIDGEPEEDEDASQDPEQLVNSAVDEIIKEHGATIEIYWDYNDSLSDKQRTKLLNAALINSHDLAYEKSELLKKIKDEDPNKHIYENELLLLEENPKEWAKQNFISVINDLENDIFERNFDYKDDNIQEYIDQIVSKEEYELLNTDEGRESLLKALEERISLDINLKDLIKNSNTFVRLNVVPINKEMQSRFFDDLALAVHNGGWQMDSCLEDDKEFFLQIADLFEINPKELYNVFSESQETVGDSLKEQYPDIPERNNPIISPKALCKEIREMTNEYGHLSITTSTDLQTIIDNVTNGNWSFADKNSSITLPKGALIFMHDHANGSCSIGEMELQRPLTLTMGKSMVTYDGQYGYGLDKICGFSGNYPWDQVKGLEVLCDKTESNQIAEFNTQNTDISSNKSLKP